MSQSLTCILTTVSGPTFLLAGFIPIRNIGSSLLAQRRWLALTILRIRTSFSFTIKALNGSTASPSRATTAGWQLILIESRHYLLSVVIFLSALKLATAQELMARTRLMYSTYCKLLSARFRHTAR